MYGVSAVFFGQALNYIIFVAETSRGDYFVISNNRYLGYVEFGVRKFSVPPNSTYSSLNL